MFVDNKLFFINDRYILKVKTTILSIILIYPISVCAYKGGELHA